MDWSLFTTVFATVFVAELGDKTQLATVLYAADERHGRWPVFLGAAAALLASTALALVLGSALTRWITPRTLSLVAGVAFIAVGVWTILRAPASA